MLVIENFYKLRNRPLNKRNFYVDSIKEIFDITPDGKGLFKRVNEKYAISITNRKYSITITLNREAKGREYNWDYALQSSTGHKIYINKEDISNIDKFINKLRLVALNKFVNY